MSIENAPYLNGLNSSNPPDGDPIGQASNHLRLIKSALKSTFPNLKGPVSSTDEQLSNGALPPGAIIIWSGSAAPTGWAICDGGTYNKADGSGTVTVPNLVGKFLRASDGSTAVGVTGGADSLTPALNIAGTALTVAQLPAHDHPATDSGHTHSASDAGHNHSVVQSNAANVGVQGGGSGYVNGGQFGTATGVGYASISVANGKANITVGTNGSNATHTHAGTVTFDNRPAFYSVLYIIKL